MDDLIFDLHARWQNDPRYALASALAAAQHGDLGEARAWLDPPAAEALRTVPSLGRLAAGDWSDEVFAAVRAGAPEDLLKLADVHFLLGDLAAEKALREKFYGSLDPR